MGVLPLQFADKDALLFYQFLLSNAGGAVPAQNIKLLINEEATAGGIMTRGISWLQNTVQPKPGDRVYFYFAGHGDAIDAAEAYLLAYDAQPGGDKNNYSVSGTINIQVLKNRIRKLTQNGVEVIFIVDACRTADIPGGSEGLKGNYQSIMENPSGDIMLLSASPNEVSFENRSCGNGHGLFTWELINGLAGDADQDQDQKVSLFEIENHVKSKVRNASKKLGGLQNPVICCSHQTETILSSTDPVWLQSVQQQLPQGAEAFAHQLAQARGGNDLFQFINDDIKKAYFDVKKYCNLQSQTGYDIADSIYHVVATKYKKEDYEIITQYYTGELLNECQRALNSEITAENVSENFDECNYYETHVHYFERIFWMMPSLKDDPELKFRLSLLEAKSLFDPSKKMRYGVDDIGNFIEFKKNGELVKEYSGETVRQLKKNILDHSPKNISSAVANYIIYELYDVADGITSLPKDSTMLFLQQAHYLAPNWKLPYPLIIKSFKELNHDSLAISKLNFYSTLIPLDADNCFFLAWLYEGLDIDKSIHYAKKTIDLDNEGYREIQLYGKVALLYKEKKNIDSTLYYLSLAFVKDSSNTYNHWPKEFPTKLLFESNQVEKIIQHFLKDYSKTDRIMLLAFSSLLSQSKTISQKVKNNLNQLVSSLSPTRLLAYYRWLSKFYLDLSNLDQAEYFIQKAYILDDQDFWTIQSYRDLCLQTKNFTKAQTLNEKLISLDASNVRHFITRCDILINLNEDKKLILSELEKTTQMAGNRASFLFKIGNLYLQCGSVSFGTEILKKASFLGFNPTNDDYDALEISNPVSPLYFTCP
jgi:hypothetical protein